MSQKRCFVFCHGFGFDATFWDPLRPFFAEMDTVYLDLGYFNEGNLNEDSYQSTDFIGIGHSLGLTKLIQSNIPFKRLVGLHGFTNFLGSNTLLRRRRQRELMHLTQQFKASPELTLSQFYQRAGVGFNIPVAGVVNQTRLLDDLALLAQSVSVPDDVPLLILGSNDDKIVPPELIEDNFGVCPHVTISLVNQTQHGLGYLKPDVVHQHIMNFLEL